MQTRTWSNGTTGPAGEHRGTGACWEKAGWFLKKLNPHLVRGQATPLAGVHPGETGSENCPHSSLCENVCLTPTTSAPNGQQPRCPAAGDTQGPPRGGLTAQCKKEPVTDTYLGQTPTDSATAKSPPLWLEAGGPLGMGFSEGHHDKCPGQAPRTGACGAFPWCRRVATGQPGGVLGVPETSWVVNARAARPLSGCQLGAHLTAAREGAAREGRRLCWHDCLRVLEDTGRLLRGTRAPAAGTGGVTVGSPQGQRAEAPSVYKGRTADVRRTPLHGC